MVKNLGENFRFSRVNIKVLYLPVPPIVQADHPPQIPQRGEFSLLLVSECNGLFYNTYMCAIKDKTVTFSQHSLILIIVTSAHVALFEKQALKLSVQHIRVTEHSAGPACCYWCYDYHGVQYISCHTPIPVHPYQCHHINDEELTWSSVPLHLVPVALALSFIGLYLISRLM